MQKLIARGLVACAALAAANAFAADTPKPDADKPRLAVLDLDVAGGVDASIGRALSEAIAAEVSSKDYFRVMTSKDIQTLLGQERQRQLLGCSEEGGTCLAELAGALGARFVLSGQVAKLGSAYQLTLQTIDSKKVQPIGRSVRIARDLEALRAQLPWAVAEATATPPPPAPSHWLAYSAIGAGAALAVGGGVIGFTGLNEETAVTKELSLGSSQRSVLKPVSYYQDAANRVRVEKSVAVAALVVGAALVGAGIYLNPSDGSSTHIAVSLAPGAASVALAGSFP
jgi:TolB-like protein